MADGDTACGRAAVGDTDPARTAPCAHNHAVRAARRRVLVAAARRAAAAGLRHTATAAAAR